MILLTGATGFIGSHLVKELESKAIPFCTLGRSDSSSVSSIFDFFEKNRPRLVVHLATLYLPGHSRSDISRLIDSNLRFGLEVMDAMAQFGCKRLINVGTMFQHYNNSEYDPLNLYAALKQSFEDCALFYSRQHGMKVLHLKLADTYGPNDPRVKIYKALLDAIVSKKKVGLSKGGIYVDPLHISDVVSGFIWAIREFDSYFEGTDEAVQTFRLSPGHPITLQSLIQVIERITQSSVDVEWGKYPPRGRENLVPLVKFSPLPGWSPKVTLEEGLREWHKALIT